MILNGLIPAPISCFFLVDLVYVLGWEVNVIFPQVHEVPPDPKHSKFKGRTSRNRAADTDVWFSSRPFNLGRTLQAT